MAGLQRSGGTAIATILNQNPDIHHSAISDLLGILANHKTLYTGQSNKDVNRDKDLDNIGISVAAAYYHNYEAKYIIDKNHWWSMPNAIESIHRYIDEDIKIICPVRDVIEVLASFSSLLDKTPNNGQNNIDRGVARTIKPDNYTSQNDKRAELLMTPNSDISDHLFGMGFARDPRYRHLFHFVEYNDFVNDPKSAIDGIYDYLEIPKFEHKFTGLDSGQNPDSATGMYDLHTVTPEVIKKSTPPEDIFSPQIIKKYKDNGYEFWRDLT